MEDDDVYSIPPSQPKSVELTNSSENASGGDLERSPPPRLLPKTGNSFRIASALLDRYTPTTSPKPAPRGSSQRTSSIDSSVENESERKTPDRATASRSKLSENLDIENSLNDSVFDSRKNLLLALNPENTSPVVQPRSRPNNKQLSTADKASAVLLSAQVGKLSSSTSEISSLVSRPFPAPRPVPKPRTKIAIPTLESDSISGGSEHPQGSNVSYPVPSDKLAFNNSTGVGSSCGQSGSQNQSASHQKAEVSDLLKLPPDADSVESMLNEEVAEKYGSFKNPKISSTEMSAASTGNEELPSSVDCFAQDPWPSNPPTAGITLDFSSALLQESSTDEQLDLFDIPAFKTAGPFSSLDSSASKKPGLPASVEMFDFSDIDPLWQEKQTRGDASQPKSTSTENKSFPLDSINLTEPTFPDNWNFDFPSATSSSIACSIDQDTYAQAYDIAEAYPQIDQGSKRPLVSSKSFHHAAPVAPPPPLPRDQNRIPEPGPPPVPPRPKLAPQPIDPKNQHAEPLMSDIFNDLPTPVFSQGQDEDPFQDSAFGSECHKFNRQLISPGTGVQAAESQHSAVDTGALASPEVEEFGPERISRFVIPPPGSVIRGSNRPPDGTYDLAQDFSSSDSEGVEESPMLECSPWPLDNHHHHHPVSVFDSTYTTKKSSREGYLCKQGGYRANKGWKKRWVVFDGTSLKYFDNNMSQISKRVIPVSCMTGVENDVRSSDKNSFKFKVMTTLKERVFIFSAESLDDCLTWANTLMAAITEHKKSQGDCEEEPRKPEREGFIRFSSVRKFYCTITGSLLRYYNSYEDFQLGSPIHEIDMQLASVKVKDRKRFKLQLWIHYGHFDLTFESDQEAQLWRMAMEDAIAEGLADDTVLDKIYNNHSNHQCADCGAPSPHWASINLGIVVCKNCAGVHRMFDYRISKIRSLRMDTRVWTPSLIELMVTIGNANANMFWEYSLLDGAKLDPADSAEKRRDFITKKYIAKRFCNLHPLSTMSRALGEELLKMASTDNILNTMSVLFSGADVLFRSMNGTTAYEISKENGQRLIMELLYQNGGDPQSTVEDAGNENRLREDVRLQGWLNKTGPVGRTFEKRWCILEHGSLTYYLNEKSTTFRGSIDRKDMLLIQSVTTERCGYQFDLSTCMKDNRIFSFSSDVKDDSGEWVRTIAKLMAPVSVMEHVGMIDIKFAGMAHMKESMVDEWRQTFLVFSWRGLNFMNQDLKFDYLDLRKASSIKMQDSSSGYQKKGPCFVISSTGRSVYLQCPLTRDTEKIFMTLTEAVTGSGPTLSDQALTNENVPVIVEKCITHIYKMGLEEKGIYRNSAQMTRVQALLDEFRKDAWSVKLTEYSVDEVANALKRFLRELDDSVFERVNYVSWINMAGCKDGNNRLMWYKYYLDKMPLVNYSTLKRLMLHLLQVSQFEKSNKMNIQNLATCLAPSLLRTESDQPNLMSDITSKEINIILELLTYPEYFFQIEDGERVIQDNIKKAEAEIQKKMQENRQSVADPTVEGILTPFHLWNRDGQSINIMVNDSKTAKESVDYVKRMNASPSNCHYSLHELLFKGALERPLFPDELVAETMKRWLEWEPWVKEDNSVCLCIKDQSLLEKLDASYNPSHVLLSKLQYCDSKSKTRFKRYTVGFRQCRLAIYNNQKATAEIVGWNVEDLTIYLGFQSKKQTPSNFCLTFLVHGEKPKASGVFGHCLSFDSEDQLYTWAASLYVAQYPKGLLSWNS